MRLEATGHPKYWDGSLRAFSPEQTAFIETWGQGVAVVAGAGSGKTTTLVAKCVRLMERQPDARFIAVSFTERSSADLRVKLAQAIPELDRHWVTTLHGLCARILREHPQVSPLGTGSRILGESESQILWESALEQLWMGDPEPAVRSAWEALLARESRYSATELLTRVRELEHFGVLPLLKQANDVSARALHQVGHFVVDYYGQLKKQQGALDFNDLEKNARAILAHATIRENYHRRFALVLIDEFQDTNQIQASLVTQLARPDRSNLCVIGDPKQSIYRFRDADLSVFNKFCAEMPVQCSLNWNFRSEPEIIAFTNQLCAPAFFASQLEFTPLVAKKVPVEHTPSVLRLNCPAPAELAIWIKREVQKGIALHEMALLLRKIRGHQAWLQALSGAGIPLAMGSGGLYWEDPRIRELVALLRWWDQPAHRLSGAVFLRAPWMGNTDETLDAWNQRDPTWAEPFFASEHPVAKLLLPLRRRSVRPGEVLLQLLEIPSIEAELAAPLLSLWHRAEDASARGQHFSQVVAQMSLAIEHSHRALSLPAPRQLGQLSVLTFHGAKGLEFEHVILVDFGEKGRRQDSPLLYWDPGQGVYLGGRKADGQRETSSPQEKRWKDLEEAQNLAESKRLCYVALTRAKRRLILVCPPLKTAGLQIAPEKDPHQSEEVYRQDYWRGWLEKSSFPLTTIDLPEKDQPTISLPSHATADAGTGPIPLGPRLRSSVPSVRYKRSRHSVTEWVRLQKCPQAYEWGFIRNPPPALALTSQQQSALVAVNAGPTDRENELKPGIYGSSTAEGELSQRVLGTRVHAALESQDLAALTRLEEEVGAQRFCAGPVVEWAKSSPWFLRPAQGRRSWAELSFEIPYESEVLVGTVDRLIFQPEPPTYVVVDYKVSSHARSAAALRAAYARQLQLYAWALRRLDTRVAEAQVEGTIVHIAPSGVELVGVDLHDPPVSALIAQSQAIIHGAVAPARPGADCRSCEFLRYCLVGLGHVLKRADQ